MIKIRCKVQGDNKAIIKYWHNGVYIGCTVLLSNCLLWKSDELTVFLNDLTTKIIKLNR